MSLREQTGPDGHQEIARHVGGRRILLFATLRAISRAFRENRINEHRKYELKDMVIDHRAQEAKEWLTSNASQSFNPNFLDRDWVGPEPTPPSFSVLSWNLQAAKTRKAALGEIGKNGRQQELPASVSARLSAGLLLFGFGYISSPPRHEGDPMKETL